MNVADGLVLGPLRGAGASGAIASETSWEDTPLGPVASWPPSLKIAAEIVLRSPLPMALLWGPDLVTIHNDACARNLHPPRTVMALPARDAFREVWPVVGPDLARVMRDGESSASEDRLIPVSGEGRLQETYFSYTHTPVFDGDGRVGGVVVTFTNRTAHVVAERRARTLRALADALARVHVATELLPVVMRVLADASLDVPLALALQADRAGALVTRASTTPSPTCVSALEHELRRRPDLGAEGSTITLEPVELPDAPWPEPVETAYALELPSAHSRTVFAFGLSPRLSFDDAYREHLRHIVDLVAAAGARIEAVEARTSAERRRKDLLRKAPVAAFLTSGPDHRFELANEAFLRTSQRGVLGKSFVEAFPDLAETEIPIVLDRVYRTGQPYTKKEQLLPLKRGGVIEDRWFSFDLQPVRSDGPKCTGIMGVIHEITDAVVARRTLERLSAEREKLLADLEAANRSKDEFLAMLGHELRNPLAPITTALYLMKLKDPNALVRERAIIERQAGHLVHLVDDLLDVSRVARGKVRLSKSRVSLAEVIARAVEMASPLFEERRHNLFVDVPDVGLDVHGDPTRLGQVFSNLLTNAAKYTEPGGHVSVRARREGDLAVVRVEDDGAGMRPDQLATIFDAFFQGPRTSDRALGGLGLGLALVKSFVTLHGGTVSAYSRGPGQGSTFEVRLPALAYDAATAQAEATEVLASHELPRRRVLVVDDSRDIVELVSTLLRYEGYEVLEAHDGPSALQAAPSFRPDVAVLDIGLPAMDGYDLAQHLREQLGEDAPKLIAMTGYGQEADRKRAREAGFDVHLVKPVDPAMLLESIRE